MKGTKSARIGFTLLLAIFLFLTITSSAQKVEDKDSFKTVKIDNQVWMLENLSIGNFKNGDAIPEAKTDEEWIQAGKDGKPAWCYYENKIDSGDLPAGQYELLLNLPDRYESLSNNLAYSIRLANENCWEDKTGFNRLGHIISIRQ